MKKKLVETAENNSEEEKEEIRKKLEEFENQISIFRIELMIHEKKPVDILLYFMAMRKTQLFRIYNDIFFEEDISEEQLADCLNRISYSKFEDLPEKTYIDDEKSAYKNGLDELSKRKRKFFNKVIEMEPDNYDSLISEMQEFNENDDEDEDEENPNQEKVNDENTPKVVIVDEAVTEVSKEKNTSQTEDATTSAKVAESSANIIPTSIISTTVADEKEKDEVDKSNSYSKSSFKNVQDAVKEKSCNSEDEKQNSIINKEKTMTNLGTEKIDIGVDKTNDLSKDNVDGNTEDGNTSETPTIPNKNMSDIKKNTSRNEEKIDIKYVQDTQNAKLDIIVLQNKKTKSCIAAYHLKEDVSLGKDEDGDKKVLYKKDTIYNKDGHVIKYDKEDCEFIKIDADDRTKITISEMKEFKTSNSDLEEANTYTWSKFAWTGALWVFGTTVIVLLVLYILSMTTNIVSAMFGTDKSEKVDDVSVEG